MSERPPPNLRLVVGEEKGLANKQTNNNKKKKKRKAETAEPEDN